MKSSLTVTQKLSLIGVMVNDQTKPILSDKRSQLVDIYSNQINRPIPSAEHSKKNLLEVVKYSHLHSLPFTHSHTYSNSALLCSDN